MTREEHIKVYDICYEKLKNILMVDANKEAQLKSLSELINLYALIAKDLMAWDETGNLIFLNKAEYILGEIIEAIENQDTNLLNVSCKNLQELYNKKCQEYQNNTNKRQVYFYGLGDDTRVLVRMLRDQVYPLAIICDDKEGKGFMGIPIISVEQAKFTTCDAIIISGTNKIDKNVKLSADLVIDAQCLIDNYGLGGYEIAYERTNLYNDPGPYNGVICGLSYIRQSIDLKTIRGKFLNFAIGGEDFYFGYGMLKKAIEMSADPSQIRTAIIGVGPYSFQYDCSKSEYNEDMSNRYYGYLHDMHNYRLGKEKAQIFDYYMQKSELYLKDNWYDEVLCTHMNEYLNYEYMLRSQVYDSGKLTKEQIEHEKKTIEQEYHKNYPETINENMKIFEQMLQYLTERHIRIIVVIPPMTELYKKYMDHIMNADTIERVLSFRKHYQFEFVNYLDNLNVDDCYFRNSSHLNGRGAELITSKLNELL